MSEANEPHVGVVGWIDLTVDDADKIRQFYSDVVGWEATPVNMGGYDDFTMITPGTGDPAAGICHARGSNEGLPTQWLMYINVADLDQSAQHCTKLGGSIVVEPKQMGDQGRYCVIRDPAGAVVALFEGG